MLTGESRNRRVEEALNQLVESSHVEVLDQKAWAQFFSGVCHDLLGHRSVAPGWYEKAFRSGCEFTDIVTKVAKKRGWLKKSILHSIFFP